MEDDLGGPRMISSLIELSALAAVLKLGSASKGVLWLRSLARTVEIDIPSIGKLLERGEN
jgi:hypothetical protein